MARVAIKAASLLASLCCFIVRASAVDPQDARDRGTKHLAQLTAQPWLADWKGATLEDVRLVEQKKDLSWPTGLPPAWWAKITHSEKGTGYLAWDSGGEGKIIEFAFDAALAVDAPDAKALKGVPAFQQFAIAQKDGSFIASGCVPTSAASVLGFWIERDFPQWRGDAGAAPLQALTNRIRARLNMQAIPDKDGYTDDAMTLAGAMPDELARALQADAAEHRVPIQSTVSRFRYETLQTEVGAGRPVLLSCTVRLPHKPQLSWGHEVAGVGWARLGEVRFVGIADNFYPVKSPATIRWLRTDAFDSLITIRPTP